MSAYAIVMVRVNDPETYRKYTAQTPQIVNKYGGKFLSRGGEVDTIEGEPFNDRLVILEFPSKQAIHDMFADPEYQTAAKYRKASSEARILAIDGIPDA
ncbi:DUF1330 domain-containing protein [Chloroflexota bacterium]